VIGRPGTALWLLGHELRLGWRRIGARRGKRRWAGAATLWLTIGVPVILTLLSIPMGLALARVPQIPIVPLATVSAIMLLAVIFTLMLSQTLAAAVDALYERNDLDLLFSSPMQPRHVMTVRFLGVALSVFSFFGYFLAGPLIVVGVMGHPGWMATLPVIFAVALAASGAGLLIAASLFRVIGPRRTRTIAQVLAALIGAAFFLMAQARNILGEKSSNSLFSDLAKRAEDPSFHPPPGFDWPLRALIGDPLPLLAVLAIGVGVFWLANAWLGPRFAADAAAAAGAGAQGGRKGGVVKAFASGPFAATLRKEWRLLARDPALITQVLIRVLYLLPLGFLALRQAAVQNDLVLPGIAAALSLMSSQVAGSLAWITISAEDAPDLLACAPAEISLVRRGKLAAAVLPVAVLLAPFLLPLVVMSPLVGVAAIAGCAYTVVATALLNLWWQRPAKRAEFRNRRRASWFVTLAELIVGLLIAAATGLFAAGLIWGLIPALVAAVGLLLLRRSDAQISEALRAAAA
jgi:ABC-2 type transport system permease protein